MTPRNRQRRRLTGALFIGNALTTTAVLGAITVASLAAAELTGSARLGGAPNALNTVGTALGAWILSALSRRMGRRGAYVLGFVVGALGGLVAMGSLWIGGLGALLVGSFAMGLGRCVGQLSRFAAGDLWPVEKRASAIAFVVWAASIGSVLGPVMIVPTSRFGELYLGWSLAGTFAFSAVSFGLAAVWYLVALRPEPLTLAEDRDDPAEGATAEGATRRPLRELLALPTVQLSFLTLIASQFVMIFLMTMTPLHIRGHHDGLTMVSGVMMAHALGMYAISPLTGHLVNRIGGRRVIALGCVVTLLSAILGAAADQAQPMLLTVALLLLGVGWNFGFVAASAVLQEGLTLRDRLQVQGPADSVAWISGGAAALTSGFVMSAGSFQVLSLVGAVIALVPLWALWREEP